MWAGYFLVGIPLGMALVSVLLDRRKVRALPVVDDAVFARHCPEHIQPAEWVAARHDLGRFLNLPADRLSPAMTLQELANRFRFLGMPRLYADLDTLEEAWREKAAAEKFSDTSSIQEVVMTMVRHSIRYP